MNITQRGVLPPVNFVELDASLQSSLLGPAGARLIIGPDIARLITRVTNLAAVPIVGGPVVIVETGPLAYNLNDLIFAHCQFDCDTSGAGTPSVNTNIAFSTATGTIRFLTDFAIATRSIIRQPNGTTWSDHIFAMGVCTVAGTISTQFRATSLGANAIFNINGATLGIIRI